VPGTWRKGWTFKFGLGCARERKSKDTIASSGGAGEGPGLLLSGNIPKIPKEVETESKGKVAGGGVWWGGGGGVDVR